MPFLSLGGTAAPRVVPGVGPRPAKIAIVGEAPGVHEDLQLKPFVGAAGGILEQCLHSAGLIRGEVYITNTVKVRPPRNDIAPYFTGKAFTEVGMPWVATLQQEMNDVRPNIIVACGATALCALTGQSAIMKYRGYIFQSRGLSPERKVIACAHPSASLRGQYLLRHLIAADIKKAKEHSASPDLVRPQRQLVYEFGSVEEVLEWLEYFEKQPVVALDIEVVNHEMSCISFASTPDIAASIPIHGRWSDLEEMQIWRALQRVLGNPHSIKVLQNGIFDIHFLHTRCGLVVRGPIRDTMIAHSIIYPELRKSLAFLVSLYGGTQAYYKDMVHFDNIKEES